MYDERSLFHLKVMKQRKVTVIKEFLMRPLKDDRSPSVLLTNRHP